MHNYMGNLVRKGGKREEDSYTTITPQFQHAFFFFLFPVQVQTFHTYASCHDVGIGVERERKK